VAPEYSFLDNLTGMVPIFLGALLATAGGLAATQMEWHFERKRRAQQAAMFFGEVLTTMHILLDIARRTHGRGDPFGPITMRTMRSAKREIDIYDRNRETLFDLADPKLRSRVHTLILRLNAPLEGVFDTNEEIRALELQLKSEGLAPALREELELRLERLKTTRDGGFEFAMENAELLLGLVRELEILAGHTFEGAQRAAAETSTIP
jgi:hypothetical protein